MFTKNTLFMKAFNFKYLLIICISLVFSCKKDLDLAPIGYVDETKLTNKKGVEGLLIGAYSLLDGFAALFKQALSKF